MRSNWAAGQGLEGDDALPDATPFPDGLPNLVRYAMNLGAGEDGSAEMKPKVVTEADESFVVLEFRVRKEMAGVQLVPQISYDLNTWNTVLDAYVVQVEDDNPETVRYEIRAPTESEGGFLRLTVTSSN